METLILSFDDYQIFRKAIIGSRAQYEGQDFLYKLFTQKDGSRIPVDRVAGRDNEGVLYIGQTTDLVNRLSLLFRSFTKAPDPEGKNGADEIYWQCEAVRRKYPSKNMFVEITPCKNGKALEMEEISKYYIKFGEVPPFNGAIVKRKKL